MKRYIYYLWKRASEKANKNLIFNQIESVYKIYQNSKTRKADKQIKHEMKILKKYWKCFPTQYFEYGMFEKGCTLSIHEMKEYVPFFFAPYLFFPRVNSLYYKILDEKNIANLFFDQYKIPHTKTLFKYFERKFYNVFEEQISETEVENVFKNLNADRIFVKPSVGLQGMDIDLFVRNNNGFGDQNGNRLNKEYFFNLKSRFYLVEQGIEQHDSINEIYPDAVNSIRIITKTINDQTEILVAFLKAGRFGAYVDNSRDSIGIKIDIDSGKLDKFAYAFDLSRLTHHSDTGFEFSKGTIPYWSIIKNSVTKYARMFSFVKYIGWDIAITPEGFNVIEINRSPGLRMVQYIYGGVKSLFEIDEPKEFYFNNKYIIEEF